MSNWKIYQFCVDEVKRVTDNTNNNHEKKLIRRDEFGKIKNERITIT